MLLRPPLISALTQYALSAYKTLGLASLCFFSAVTISLNVPALCTIYAISVQRNMSSRQSTVNCVALT
jgi:hypothetical protein